MLKKAKQLCRKLDTKLFNSGLRRLKNKISGKKSMGTDIMEFLSSTKYASQTDEYFADTAVREKLLYVDPKRLICSGRLDVIVRYLLFRDIAWEIENDAHKSLYCRTVLARTGAIEPTGFFSETDRSGG